MYFLDEGKLLLKAGRLCLKEGELNVHLLSQNLGIGIFEAVVLKEQMIKSKILTDTGQLSISNEQELLSLLPKIAKAEMPELKQSYYDSIMDFSKDLFDLFNLMLNDYTILINVSHTNTVRYCLVYDLIQILKYLGRISFVQDRLESIAFVFAVHSLPQKEEKVFNASYSFEEMRSMYEANQISVYLEEILNSHKSKISIDNNFCLLCEVVTLSEKIDFSMPNFLFAHEHKYFNQYILMLLKFSNLICFSDNRLSRKEEELIEEINLIKEYKS